MKYNLSEITEVIRNRRTIYPEDFTDRKVHREIVEHVLQNGTWAPSHGMTQPWRFHVYMGEALKKLAVDLPEFYKNFVPAEKFSQKKYEKFQARPEKVSVMIFVSVETTPESGIPELEEQEAVACAVQNMHLTCTAYGLGAFWSSPKFLYTREFADYLGLSENGQCVGLFFMGYPAIEWPKSHRKPLEYVTKWIDE